MLATLRLLCSANQRVAFGLTSRAKKFFTPVVPPVARRATWSDFLDFFRNFGVIGADKSWGAMSARAGWVRRRLPRLTR